MTGLVQDVRFTTRQLMRSPGLAATVIVTLAAGIAATVAMFAVVDKVLLRPLPYPRAAQLVEIKESGKNGPAMFGAPFLDIREWRERSRSFQSIAFHIYDKPTCFIEGTTGPVQVNAPRVSSNLFTTLGVKPALGRTFDDGKGHEFASTAETNAAVLSDSVWRDGFGADATILGRVIRLNGESYTVIGVMPRGFQFPFNTEKPQIWVPVALADRDEARIKNSTPEYRVIARLKDGVGINTAVAELRAIQANVAKQYTNTDAAEEVTSVDMHPYGQTVVKGNVKAALIALLIASCMLWLIACVNVTSLMLARAAARQRELAVRGALGASTWRIVRQQLIEGLVLSGVASLLGLSLVFLALKSFEHQLAIQLGVQVVLSPNVALTSFLLGLTLVSAVASSVWPALIAISTPIELALRQGGPQTGKKNLHRARTLLVVGETAMSLVLLIACGLLLRTIYALRHVSLGYRTDHVIVADMAIPAYKFDGRNMTTELYEPLVERVQHLPGVQAATLTTAIPLGKRFPILFTLTPRDQHPNAARKMDVTAQFRAVGPGLQRVFGFHMLAGRFFNDGDTPGSAPVVVVNRAFVKAYLGEDEPRKILGERLLSYKDGKPAEIVGVIDDERQASVAQPSQPEIEVCIPQITPDSAFYGVAEGLAMNLAVRTDRRSDSFVPQLREVLRETTSELGGSTFSTMDQVVADSYGDQRTAARLLQMFAGSALILCIVGIYGLLSYLVSQRTRELGVRIALGAQRFHVIAFVMREAFWMLFVGAGLGMGISYFLGRAVASSLYEVKAHDAITVVAATFLLVGSGLLAAYLPARRAAEVDPMQALRAE